MCENRSERSWKEDLFISMIVMVNSDVMIRIKTVKGSNTNFISAC